MLQRAELFEHGSVSRDGIRRVEAAGAATAGFFAVLEMRRGVGAEEETIRTAGDRLTQRFLVDIALEDRQAEQVWANAAHQHVVAVEHQVLWRDGGAEETIACLHILRRFFGGDVLETIFSSGNWRRIGSMTCSIKRASRSKISTAGSVTSPWISSGMPILHLFEQRVNAGHVADAVAGVGRSVGRIQLGGGKHPCSKPLTSSLAARSWSGSRSSAE